MDTIDELLLRDGLEPGSRLRVLGFAALCCADEAVLRDSAQRLRAAGASSDEIREILVQGIAYCGFPRALQGLFWLADELDDAPREHGGERAHRARGEAYFASIYGGTSERLVDKIRALDPVFAELVLDVAYGAILSREGLAPRDRELMGVAGLSVLGHAQQMLSHAIGARRHGAAVEAVLEVIDTVDRVWPENHALGHRSFLEGHFGGT